MPKQKYNTILPLGVRSASTGTVSEEARTLLKAEEAIWEAAVSGRWGVVRQWIERFPSLIAATGEAVIEDVNYFDLSLLHLAAALNPDVNFLRYLISAGADVNEESDCEHTPLYYAARYNPNVDALEYLVSLVPNADEEFFLDVWFGAVRNPNVEMIDFLVSSDSEIVFEPNSHWFSVLLEEALLSQSNVEVIAYLISYGADVDSEEVLENAVLGFTNPDVMQYLISKGADLDARDKHGRTLVDRTSGYEIPLSTLKYIVCQTENLDEKDFMEVLYRIVEASDAKTMQFYLSRCTNVDINALLCRAAGKNSNLDIFEYLVSLGADVNTKTYYYGGMPLWLAAEGNSNVAVLKYLRSQGADLTVVRDDSHESLLHCAARNTNLDVLKYIVSLDANFNVRDRGKKTLLHCAAQNPNLDVLKYLVSQGVDLNAKDEYGHTPLCYAVCNPNIDVMKYLISSGADVNAKDLHGDRLLSHLVTRLESCRHGERESSTLTGLKYLVPLVDDINAKGTIGATALHWAAMGDAESGVSGRHVAAMKHLVLHGADIYARDEEGSTPLHCAARNTFSKPAMIRMVQYLIDLGTDVNVRDFSGRTPLHASVSSTIIVEEMLEYLISRGADIDARDASGDTPLHYAIRVGCQSDLRTLVRLGADVHVKNNEGLTPLDYAGDKRSEIQSILKCPGDDA